MSQSSRVRPGEGTPPGKNCLVIRADANASLGSGHVMRCLALAQAWNDRGMEAFLATASLSPGLKTRLERDGVEMSPLRCIPGTEEDADLTAAIARNHDASWVVVDGYRFGERYQRALKERGCRVLFIDDNGHAGHYSADMVLNQNLYASEELYLSRDMGTRLLLGTRYTLLRSEFLKWRNWSRQYPDVAEKILISLGGGDPENVTGRVLEALQQIEGRDLIVRVIIGPSSPYGRTIREMAGNSNHSIEVFSNIMDMADFMAWADLSISGGGSSCYEIAFMGVPNCIIITADNQVRLAESFGNRGLSINAGWYHALTTSALKNHIFNLMENQQYRKEMGIIQRRLLDGKGAGRVVQCMVEWSGVE